MKQKMNEQVEENQLLEKKFNKWTYEVLKSFYKKRQGKVYPYVDIVDAKFHFLDGKSAEEYLKNIKSLTAEEYFLNYVFPKPSRFQLEMYIPILKEMEYKCEDALFYLEKTNV